MNLWDTPGNECYDRLRPLSYPGADVFLVCFSVIDPDTLENVEPIWYPEVRYFCRGVPIILVGNKTDLRTDTETIERLRKRYNCAPFTEDEGRAMAKRIGVVAYVECSALINEGIHEVFETAVRAAIVYQNKKKQSGCSVS